MKYLSWQQDGVSAPTAEVLTPLHGLGRREKAEMPRGLALLGRDLFGDGQDGDLLGRIAQLLRG